ncbi:MAG TPA: FAD:protein FMN transferase [Chryseosolibacter sp.]|nr:FAD:protein FMN transferase [Chryseosolibacter sp.]
MLLAVHAVLTFFLFFLAPIQPDDVHEPLVIEGRTMGTSYRIIYFDEPRRRDFKVSVDSVLTRVNQAINTYDPESEISRFNRSESGIRLELPYLHDILRKAKKIFQASDGAFDPTVMPLVNAWGFGPGKLMEPTPHVIDSLKQFVGFDKIRFNKRVVRKSHPGVQLDMGGIGQGFGADVIGDFLRSKGIRHMLIELGGEGLACGKNLQKDKPWRVGILDPNSTSDNQFFKAYVTLRDKAFTTSGNYFNYRVINGRKFGHTVDPREGRPVQHSLLSASVFARDCTSADAWATAFMVMGIEKAIVKVKRLSRIEALFIYSAENGALRTYVTPRIEKETVLE